MQLYGHIEMQWYCLLCYKLPNDSISISTSLKGNVKLSGLTYAMPFPVIIWHGIKDVLLSFSTKDIIPVYLGNILTLFLATSGIEICCMYNHLEA